MGLRGKSLRLRALGHAAIRIRRGVECWLVVAVALTSGQALVLTCCLAYIVVDVPHGSLHGPGLPTAIVGIFLLGMTAIALCTAASTAAHVARDTRRLRRWVAAHRINPPDDVADAAAELRLSRRVWVVDTPDRIAATIGFVRARIVISSGLVLALSPAQLRVVLAHERAHARHRDPLRLLIDRVLAAHLWFLPVAGDVRDRAACQYELAADRHATRQYGRSVVAEALLSVVQSPSGVRVGASFDQQSFLAARIAQLESGRSPRLEPIPLTRITHSAPTRGFLIVSAVAWMLMLVASTGCAGLLNWP